MSFLYYLSLSITASSLGSGAFVASLPGPSGPCNVQLHSAELTDQARVDPFDPAHRKRSIIVSTYSPTQCGAVQSSAYFPPLTAKFEDEEFQAFGIPNGTYASLRGQSHRPNCADQRNARDFPLVVFSPALATSRLLYTLLLQDIASSGFAVVSIDHPYDADIVEFPDGRVVLGTLANISTEAEVDPDLNVRVADVSFVLDILHQRSNVDGLFPSLLNTGGKLRLDQVAALGHSLGGATAAQVMLTDDRFVGGINLDGALWGPVAQEGLSSSHPFLIFAHTNHTQNNEPSWASFLSNSSGWKVGLELANSQHYTFSDFPMLVAALDIAPAVKGLIQATRIGTVGALRARNVVTTYVTAAFGFFFTKKLPDILRGPSDGYGDVSFQFYGQSL
jgi:hypothetical protein